MDFDDAAMFGMGNAGAAPLLTRVGIQFDCDASDDELASLVDTALNADTYYLALRDPQKIETKISRI